MTTKVTLTAMEVAGLLNLVDQETAELTATATEWGMHLKSLKVKLEEAWALVPLASTGLEPAIHLVPAHSMR